jgi:hypothetical protein
MLRLEVIPFSLRTVQKKSLSFLCRTNHRTVNNREGMIFHPFACTAGNGAEYPYIKVALNPTLRDAPVPANEETRQNAIRNGFCAYAPREE